jgi:hypothetical protein
LFLAAQALPKPGAQWQPTWPRQAAELILTDDAYPTVAAVRFQEILRRLAMIDEGFVETRPDQT